MLELGTALQEMALDKEPGQRSNDEGERSSFREQQPG